MASVTSLGNGQYRVMREDGSASVAFAAGSWVFIDGDVFIVPGADAAGGRRRTSDHAELAAPMPASVVSIRVNPGDAVATGDVLILLEAMKMELPIKAPRDGTVGRLHCREGELVQAGVPLIELA